MTKPPRKPYEVGYGKPPSGTRFRKGISGNPGGRPRGITGGRATALAIKEAYRAVTVREGDKVITMPAIQAVLRSQIALAAKGNGPAQRTLINVIRAIERENAAPADGGDLRRGLAERLAAALKRVGEGTDDHGGSIARGSSQATAARSVRTR